VFDDLRAQRGRWLLLAMVAFGLSYSVLPLYSSNQNHHLLTGIARAGEGWLIDDWLVHTVDPFPLATGVVWLVHRFAFDAIDYVLYFLLLGAYAYGLMRVAEHLWPVRRETAALERLWWLTIMCLLHNEVVGYLLGVDLPRLPWWQMTHWGVAEQEIFGHSMFQPSAVGLLLPLALAWHLDGRPVRAATLTGAVLLVHFSYVLIGACLVSAFMVTAAQRTRSLVAPAVIGAVGLAFAIPAIIYVVARLSPTDAETSRRSAAILVGHIRQEADPHVWLGAKAAVQVLWMIAGVVLASGTELFLALLAPLLLGVALTSAQIASGNTQLALLFPWRVSVLLVPVSTALIVRALIAHAAQGRAWTTRHRQLQRLAGAAITLSALLGCIRMTLTFAYFYDDRPLTARLDRVVPERWRRDFAKALRPDTLPMMEFVRETAIRGDLYVVPPELERFRLRTGAPIVADAKSHPYKDVEVIEWYTRLQLVSTFYGTSDCDVLRAIANRYAATHVVLDERVRRGRCPGLARVYSDPVFEVDRIVGTADAKIGYSACCDLTARFDSPVP